jgi:hypothetical protein
MPLEGKKAIHESMKSELLTFERIKIAFEQSTCFKRWKYGSGWGYNVTDSTNTKPTAVIL